MAQGKSPLETYGRRTVFTAQRRRTRNRRLRVVLSIMILVALAAVAAWMALGSMAAAS